MPQSPHLGRKVSQLLLEGRDIGRVVHVSQRGFNPRESRILRPLGRFVLSDADWCRLPFNGQNGCLERCNVILQLCNLGALGACSARIA